MMQVYRIFYEFVLKPVATNELLIASAIRERVTKNRLISAFYMQLTIFGANKCLEEDINYIRYYKVAANKLLI